MSLLIKGMEMPDRCYACPLCNVDGDGGVLCAISHGSYIEYKDVDESIAIDHRPDDCPLVPVPPHGRLIDASELQRNIHEHDYVLVNEWNSTDKGMFTFGIDYAISVAPTIIPAESEDE